MKETESVTVKGVQIAYWEHGDRGSPVIVYVHGNTGSKLWFESVMRVSGYYVLAPDLPNFGDSDRLDSCDIDRYAFYLAEFLHAMGVRNAYVVGHSLGGAVAISLTVGYPKLSGRLLLVDSAPLEGLHTPEEYYPVIESYKNDAKLLKEALRGVTPTLEDEERLNRLTESALQMNPIAFGGNPRALDRFDYRGRAAEVGIPVLVVRGELDGLITEEMARNTAKGFAEGRFRSLGAVGHSVMVEDPERFTELVQEFGAE
mgnify:CR=1 FL=1